MRFERKENPPGYQEQEKRFLLSEEDFAKERLRGVKEVVSEIKKDNPEVLSFCMFGSMVKGAAKPESDIDGYLFVDADLVAEKQASRKGKKEQGIIEDHDVEGWGLTTAFSEKISEEYGEKFDKALQEKLELSPKQTEHVLVLPISEGIIDSHIQDLSSQAGVWEEYEEKRCQWRERREEAETEAKAKEPKGAMDFYAKMAKVIAAIRRHEDDPVDDATRQSLIQEDIDIASGAPPKPEAVLASRNLFGMFHLDVGGGIRKYRDCFLSKLQGMGPRGERIWHEVAKNLEAFEQALQLDIGKRYPRTLEEAIDVYGTRKKE